MFIAPTEWSLVGTDAMAGRSADKRKGDYSATLTTTVDGRLLQVISGIDHLKGRYVTFSCWVKANYVPDPDVSVVRLRIDDGVGSTKSELHKGDDSWQLLSVKRKIDASASIIQFDIDAVGVADMIEIDQAIAVEGIQSPLPSDAPLLDSKRLFTTEIYDPANMATDGDATSTTISCNGAKIGDPVIVSLSSIGANDILISGFVEESDLVRVVLLNKSGGGINIAPGTLKVMVFKY